MNDKRSPYSFLITDLLIVLAMIGAGQWVLSRFFFEGYSKLPPTWMFVTVILTGSISAAITTTLINRKNIAGTKRPMRFIPAGTVTIILSGVLAESLHREFMADNERDANKTCIFLAEAQESFHRTDWDADGVLEFAQKISELWETIPGTRNVALINAEILAADARLPKPKPSNGYIYKSLQFRIVNNQKISYIVADGNQTLGYAFMAFPAKYDGTGINTLFVSNTGIILKKDLGPDTASIAAKIDAFEIPAEDTVMRPE